MLIYMYTYVYIYISMSANEVGKTPRETKLTGRKLEKLYKKYTSNSYVIFFYHFARAALKKYE